MKATKISFNPKILSTFLGLTAIIFTLLSCDVVEDDPDVLDPDTNVTNNRVHVYSDNTSVIDLNSILKTTQPVRLEITSQTSKGELTNLGKGLIQYVPVNPTSKARDTFGFAVYSESNQILKTDSVVIIIENDSSALPCGVFPMDDYLYNVVRYTTITIDVLANDILCGHDSSDVTLSIYQPDWTFPPHFGSAEIVNNKIVYHVGASFSGYERIVYRVTDKDGSVAYGFVYIQPKEEPCEFELHDDLFTLRVDTVGNAGILLPVFSNDILCETYIAIDELHIYKAPQGGSATINTDGITFTPPTLQSGQIKRDTIGYELCFDTQCYRARAAIELRKD